MDNRITLYHNTNRLVNDAYGLAVFNLCMHRERHGYKVFALCGCEAGVGTTSVSLDLSILLAEIGWRTLLLDGDLRKDKQFKRIHKEYDLNVGLSDFISGRCQLGEIIHLTDRDKLFYVPSGRANLDNPLAALASSKMAGLFESLSAEFDCVIVDTPSLSAAVDSKFYAMRADAAILVAAMNGNRKKHLEETYRQLTGCEANVIGVIETKVSLPEYKKYSKDFDYFTNMKPKAKRR